MSNLISNHINDKEFSKLTTDEKIDYLNHHNYGVFRKLTDEEVEDYKQKLMKNKNKDFVKITPYAIREETNDLVVIENKIGTMDGKLSPRLFVNVPENK